MESIQKAPDFNIPNQHGKNISINDFPGKWIILYFYPKDNTPGCTTEASDFTSLIPDFTALNAEVIGVSPDSVESHQKFIEKHDLGISLLSDPEKKLLVAYGAWGIKKNYGREYEGVIRSTFIISPDGVLIDSWLNVKAKGHAERVKKKLIDVQKTIDS